MAKKKKNVIPKKVAGFKVPKSVRKSSVLQALLRSDIGRDVLANALTAGAGAAAAVLMRDREDIADTGKKGVRKGTRAITIATEALENATSAAMDVVKDSAYSLLPKDVRKTATKTKGSPAGQRDRRPFAGTTAH